MYTINFFLYMDVEVGLFFFWDVGKANMVSYISDKYIAQMRRVQGVNKNLTNEGSIIESAQ